MSYENIQVETIGRVGIIRFHRPQALYALNAALVKELSRHWRLLPARVRPCCSTQPTGRCSTPRMPTTNGIPRR